MRSRAHIKSHPLHPMLVVFPFAYLFGSACLDAWSRITGQTAWLRTARQLNGLGLGSALVAAIPGLVDYRYAVPPRSSAKDRATKHMLANLSAVALFTAARAGRGGDDRQPAAWALAAEIGGAGLLAAGGWMGGTLVYRNQIAVDHRYADAGRWRELTPAPEERTLSGRVDVGAPDDLGINQMKLVRVGARRIVLARTERGYAAFDDRCTHKGGSLADGSLTCGVVQCPWHGSQFEVTTGHVKHGPAEERITTYRVDEAGGRLYLDTDSLQ
jgi:nitrite reductase/ring-hydroxylating ferredoxin subunit/uncharacterized membrane protein